MSKLSPDFLHWWFAPWQLGAGRVLPVPAETPALQRDAFHAWCRQTGVPAGLPARYEAGWQAAALQDEELLRRCCTLYGGLFAARAQDQAQLQALPLADRQWCLSVALGQPLQAGVLHLAAGSGAEQRGTLELAWRLEAQFPGLWPRLRRLLPETPATPAPAPGAGAAAALLRGQRCWAMCLARAHTST